MAFKKLPTHGDNRSVREVIKDNGVTDDGGKNIGGWNNPSPNYITMFSINIEVNGERFQCFYKTNTEAELVAQAIKNLLGNTAQIFIHETSRWSREISLGKMFYVGNEGLKTINIEVDKLNSSHWDGNPEEINEMKAKGVTPMTSIVISTNIIGDDVETDYEIWEQTQRILTDHNS